MDGHFVPPITIGPLIVSALADRVHSAGGALDVHLMIERPEGHVAEFAKAGADGITIHAEATPHLHYTLAEIRAAGCGAGIAICPGTHPLLLAEVAEVLASASSFDRSASITSWTAAPALCRASTAGQISGLPGTMAMAFGKKASLPADQASIVLTGSPIIA